MKLHLIAAALSLLGLAACSGMKPVDSNEQARLDIASGCVNMPPVTLEVCRRSGQGGLSSGPAGGM